MKDYFIIIANSDLKNYSELKTYLESTGKITFIPSLDIDSNELYGIKVMEALKDSNEIIVLQTPSLPEDEKAMDQVFLAYSIKPGNIVVWEPESFKVSHELKSYLKKCRKNSNINELLNIPENNKEQKPESEIEEISIQYNLQSHEEIVVEEKQPINQELSKNSIEKPESISSFEKESSESNVIIPSNPPTSLGITPENKEIKEKEAIKELRFSFDEKNNLWVSIDWIGEKNRHYLITVSLKKFSKNKFKEKGQIMKEATGDLMTNNCMIENIDLPLLDSDKTNPIVFQISLYKRTENGINEIADSCEIIKYIHYTYKWLSKDIYSFD